MKNSTLTDISTRLQQDSFFDFFNSIVNIDELIDARYSPSFESIWLSDYERLQPIELNAKDQGIIDTLREHAFKKVFTITQDSELSGLVSDDIELIMKSTLSQPSTNVQYLWESYKNGSFPYQYPNL